MNMTRLLAVIGIFIATAGIAAPVSADAYPARPIQMIVPFPPGGSTDVMARVLARTLQDSLGQPVVVQNRAGAGGVIGTDATAKSAADGYTILLSSSAPLAVGLSLMPSIPYKVLEDLVPVSMVGDVPLVLVTNPKLKLDSLDALIAQCKARPGEVAFALNALGSQAHLLTELFQLRTGAAINMIPYKGSGPAVVDLLGGVVAADIENMPAVLEHIRSGSLRALAILSSDRSTHFPAVPTMAELGYPEFVASPWFAVMAPKGTDPKIIGLLNRHINEALQSKAVVEAFAAQGATPVIATPDQTRGFIADEIQRWAGVVRETGAKLK
ncbi:Bug family tripartite tricarboxylate transporter substrate binding protein [Bordetella bronchiseptica]|uniref:Bug family tripartite tricarboxylate transporter substrate binding protein n=1 Tax=Bordetella bronchiseptica TaxID=518 RepID=UPI000290644D|nr:tripartite tricarboxylate transporter substrate binding protein [Bordetella bronchiseptica]AWQ07791.1 protein BugT [Bordetella bronchiseptica]KAK55006.1 tripartite tricarboxylate transporter family receptor [Bordetella bronchiseptica OSU054]KDB74546.1 tripartite tricarboxylate transporter family receptor [Bordetella bronchiseptica CA90 BB1334]KDC16988.1 tripartite tricarboxylate transporter family receptor [Bordetella bronchiseptica F-1]KDC18501.1 tripartite tricarboxylate transporter famil